MTRTNDEIIVEIKKLLEEKVAPNVAYHGGFVNFISYDDGVLRLQLAGACSGCSGSTTTIKQGVEIMMKHFIPELKEVVAENDPNSTAKPYYS